MMTPRLIVSLDQTCDTLIKEDLEDSHSPRPRTASPASAGMVIVKEEELAAEHDIGNEIGFGTGFGTGFEIENEVEKEIEKEVTEPTVDKTPSSLSSMACEMVTSLRLIVPKIFLNQPVVSKRDRSQDLTEDLQIVDASLLRATSSRSLLRGFGTIFREASGDERTFEMSRPVEVIDKFLSHSWCTPGWLKTLMLLYQTNLMTALLAALLTAVLVNIYEYHFVGEPEHLPCMGWSYVPGSGGVTAFWLDIHFLAPCLAFLIFLLFGHELPTWRRESYFLDKCCIHQEDIELKRLGIQQLGRFIRVSRTLVILWQPEYLTRLWCVYELAAFHYINRDIAGTIELLPLKLSVLWLGLFLFHLVACISFAFVGPLTVLSKWHADWTMASIPAEYRLIYICCLFWLALFSLYLVPGFLLWRFCRGHVLDRRLLLHQLSNFRMDQTDCTKESDRRFVEGKIARWFGSTELFEEIVRTELHARVKRGTKEHGHMPWRMILVGSLSHFFAAVSLVADAHQRKDYDAMVRCICLGICIVFCTDAIAMRFGLYLAAKSVGRTPTRRSTMGYSCLVASAFALLNGLALCLACSSVPIALAICSVIFAGIITWLLYGGWGQTRRAVERCRRWTRRPVSTSSACVHFGSQDSVQVEEIEAAMPRVEAEGTIVETRVSARSASTVASLSDFSATTWSSSETVVSDE